MKIIRAFLLRIIFHRYVVKLNKHPVLKGSLFQRIKIVNIVYYYVGKYKVLKSRNQKINF